MTQRARHLRERYRNDPVYRAMILASNKAFREPHRDSAHHELELVREAIYRIRESYQERMVYAERLFAKLQRLIMRRADLEKSGRNGARRLRRENASRRTTLTARDREEVTEVTDEQIGLAEQLDRREASAKADKNPATVSRDQLLRLLAQCAPIRVEAGLQRDPAPGGTMVGRAEVMAPWAKEDGDNPDPRIAICGLEGEHDMSASWAGQRWRAPRSYSTKEPRREVIWFSPNCLKPLANLFYQDAQKQPEPV